MNFLYLAYLFLLFGLGIEGRIVTASKRKLSSTKKTKDDWNLELNDRIDRYLKDERNDGTNLFKLFDMKPKIKEFHKNFQKISTDNILLVRTVLDISQLQIDSNIKQTHAHLKKSLKTDSPKSQFLLDDYFNQLIKNTMENYKRSLVKVGNFYLREYELTKRQIEKLNGNATNLKDLYPALVRIIDTTNTQLQNNLIKDKKLLIENVVLLRNALMEKFNNLNYFEPRLNNAFTMLSEQLVNLENQCIAELDEILINRRQILLAELGAITEKINTEQIRLVDIILEKCRQNQNLNFQKCEQWIWASNQIKRETDLLTTKIVDNSEISTTDSTDVSTETTTTSTTTTTTTTKKTTTTTTSTTTKTSSTTTTTTTTKTTTTTTTSTTTKTSSTTTTTTTISKTTLTKLDTTISTSFEPTTKFLEDDSNLEAVKTEVLNLKNSEDTVKSFGMRKKPRKNKDIIKKPKQNRPESCEEIRSKENLNEENKEIDSVRKLSVKFLKNKDFIMNSIHDYNDVDDINDGEQVDNDEISSRNQVDFNNENSLVFDEQLRSFDHSLDNNRKQFNLRKLRVSLYDEDNEPGFYLNGNYICIKLSPRTLKEIQGL